MSETILEIENLSVVYETDMETVHAVNGISFSLGKGETLGLVGETGAGKTTTALTILGLLPERTGKITGGAIRFEGTELGKLSAHEMEKIRGARISMIFQDPMSALNPVLTVGSQIAEALELHNTDGLSKKEIEYLPSPECPPPAFQSLSFTTPTACQRKRLKSGWRTLWRW